MLTLIALTTLCAFGTLTFTALIWRECYLLRTHRDQLFTLPQGWRDPSLPPVHRYIP